MANNSNNFKDKFTVQIVSRKPLNMSFLHASYKDWLNDITVVFKSIVNDIISKGEYDYILSTINLFEVKKSEDDSKIVITYNIKLTQFFIEEFNEQYDFDIEIFIKNMFIKVIQILNEKLEQYDAYKQYIVTSNKLISVYYIKHEKLYACIKDLPSFEPMLFETTCTVK